jgi:O-antigen/teichoic acid export membrane protein
MTSWLSQTLRRQILGGSVLSIAIRVAGVGLSYLAHVLLSRILGASGYGQYAIALGWALVLVLPARMGFDYSAIRYGTMYLESDDRSSLRGFIRVSIGSVTFASLLIGIIMVLAASAFASRIAVLTMAAAAALLPALALVGVLAVLMRITGRYFASQFYDQVLRPAGLILLLGLFLLNNASLSARAAVLLTSIAAWLSLAALGWHFRTSFARVWTARPSFIDMRKWYVLSLPLLGVTVAQELLNQLEVILLGALADPRSAGLFSAASRLVSLMTFALAAFGIVGGPLIASAYHRGNFDELQYVTKLTTRLGLIFAVGIALLLVVGGKLLLGLFGPEFREAYVPLLILVAGGVVNAITGIVVYLATLTGRERPALVIFLSALAISLVLNLLLIPRLGIVGAAVASSTALSFWNLAMLAFVRRELGIDASAFGFRRRRAH